MDFVCNPGGPKRGVGFLASPDPPVNWPIVGLVNFLLYSLLKRSICAMILHGIIYDGCRHPWVPVFVYLWNFLFLGASFGHPWLLRRVKSLCNRCVYFVVSSRNLAPKTQSGPLFNLSKHTPEIRNVLILGRFLATLVTNKSLYFIQQMCHFYDF